MTKDELLEALEHCRKTEESAIPLYIKHLNSTLFLSDFSKDEKQKIIALLKMLSSESQGHAQAFDGLINKVKESSQNVY